MPQASYDVAFEVRGSDWIDLAADQCTMYYTSEGTSVKRFNVCTNTQLTDFATGLLGSNAFAVKLLPGGGALVADRDAIRRLDADGAVTQTYDATGDDHWFALALDPGATSFWASDAMNGDVKKFDLASGAVLVSFNTGLAGPDRADGLAIAR